MAAPVSSPAGGGPGPGLTFARLGFSRALIHRQSTGHATHREQASMIRRYIIWRNSHAYDERLSLGACPRA